MQFPRRGQPAPLGVLYDSSLDGGIDQILALAMLFGFAALQQVRIPSLTTSRFNLQNAAFLDVVARFFAADLAGDFVPNKIPLPIGMASTGKQTDAVPPMVSVAARQSRRRRQAGLCPRRREAERHGRSGGADAQRADGAGRSERRRDSRRPPGESALADGAARRQGLGGEEGARAEHCRRAASTEARPIRSFAPMLPGFRKLLAEWPARIVMAGAELNEALPFPGSSLDAIAAWAPNHPVVDAYRAFKPMPADAPSQALAAVLYAVSPEDNYFALSEPGTITILDNGRTRFTPSPGGRHHYLIARPDQKERVLETYVKLITTQPPPPPARGPARRRARRSMLGAAHRREPDVRACAHQRSAAGRRVRHRRAPGARRRRARNCHGEQRPAGGMSVTGLTSAESLVQHRDVVGSDPSPPPRRRHAAGRDPRPDPAQLAAMTGYIERAFERADASVKPDPGRMTAHRLNRNEYTNTIRDLLGVRVPRRAVISRPTTPATASTTSATC